MTAAELVDRPSLNPGVRFTAYFFHLAYGAAPEVAWQAPGALTLLDGPETALTAAIPWGTIVAAGRHPDGATELYSMNHHDAPYVAGSGPAPGWAARCLDGPAGGAGVRLVVNDVLPAGLGLLAGGEAACAASLAAGDLGFPGRSPTGPSYVTARHARAGHALLAGPDGHEHLPFDLAAAGLRLLIIATDSGAARTREGDVAAAAGALRRDGPAGLGPPLTAAHVPGVPALDRALEAALAAGALGGRAAGRCVIALAPWRAVPAIRAAVTGGAADRAGRSPRILSAVPVSGARRAG